MEPECHNMKRPILRSHLAIASRHLPQSISKELAEGALPGGQLAQLLPMAPELLLATAHQGRRSTALPYYSSQSGRRAQRVPEFRTHNRSSTNRAIHLHIQDMNKQAPAEGTP